MNYFEDLNLRDIEYLDEEGILQIEKWVTPYKYFDKYQISNLGRVKSLNFNNTKREGIIKQSITNSGYYNVRLRNINGKLMNISIHQLVAVGFLDYILGDSNKVIDHKNNIKIDNRATNLQIVTPRFNVNKHKIIDGVTISQSWKKSEKDWRPVIVLDGERYSLGSYLSSELASEAYSKALFNWEELGTFPKRTKIERGDNIRYIKDKFKWSARVAHKGKIYHIGYYSSEQEAIDAKEHIKTDIESFLKNKHNQKKNFHFHKKSGKWIVCLCINNKKHSFGRFETEEEARELNSKLIEIKKNLSLSEYSLDDVLIKMFEENLKMSKKHEKYFNNLNNKK